MKRLLYTLLGALTMLVGLELLLRVLPVSTSTQTGYYIHPNILTKSPHHEWTASTGWSLRNAQQLRSNNMGFAAEHDFVRGSNAIGLVGDSYVEASMLAPRDRPAAQLERELEGRLVYAMGGPGTSLLDYGERIQWAHETLGLRQFVVLMEPADASQALCGSGNGDGPCLDPQTLEPTVLRQSPPGFLKRVLRQSAFAQYLSSQLKFSASRLTSPAFWSSGVPLEGESPAIVEKTATSGIPEISSHQAKVIDTAIDVFLQGIAQLDGLHVLFVVDMNRRNLDADVLAIDEGHHVARRLEEKGFTVVRGEPLYREHMRRSPLRLDVGPHDGHLNPVGVNILMTAAAQAVGNDMKNSIDKKRN